MKKWIVLLFLFVLFGCKTPDGNQTTKEYEVKFISNSEEVITAIKIKFGFILDSKILPEPLEVDGYVFDGWYVDADFTESADGYKVKKELTLYGKWSEVLPTEEELALADLKLVSRTYEQMDLPSKAGGFDLIWYSSNTDIISTQGKVKRLTEEATVEMTATILTDDIYEKVFVVTVEKYPYELKFNEVFASIQFPDVIDKNITLETRFSNIIRGTWSSDKSTIISSLGIVSLTHFVEEVTLTLTLEMDKQTATTSFVVYTKAVKLTVNDSLYFINQLEKKGIDVISPIMTMDQINSFNQTVIDTPSTNTILMANHSNQISGNEVLAKILRFSAVDYYAVYDGMSGVRRTDAEIEQMLENTNLRGVPETINVRYAVSTTHTLLRGYPTHDFAQTHRIDRFQETGFSLGTPMIIYHTSIDQKWFFVRMYNYDGWVPADSVGLCSREEFLTFVNPENFVVVLDDFVYIQEEWVRMGTKIPYSLKVGDQYSLSLPTRSLGGELLIKEVRFDGSTKLSDGYIPYTYSNLLNQAYKCIGTIYSWGDKISVGMDCSSTQAAIFACFGFVLGRNTSNQRLTNIYGKTVSNISNESLKGYPVGTLLYTTSHVLMYIGSDDNGNAWLLHNTTDGNICKIEALNSYGSSSIAWTLGMYLNE